MSTLTTIIGLALVCLTAYAMGVGVVKLLLPPDLEEEFGTLVAPTVGYLTFCFLSFTLSASAGITANAASWTVFALLIGTSVFVCLRRSTRLQPRREAARARWF